MLEALPLRPASEMEHLFKQIFFREGKADCNEHRKIGDLVLKHMNQNTMEHYCRFIDTHNLILEKLEQSLHRNSKFEQVYRDFEMQKVSLKITK